MISEEKRQYNKIYYEKNKLKFRKYALDYYHNNKTIVQEKHKEYCKQNRQKILDDARRYRLEHGEIIKQKKKQEYMKNRDQVLKIVKDYNQKQKFEALSCYSKGIPNCNCCGERIIEFLTIDHINGNGSTHRKQLKIEGGQIYRWLKKNGYPEGFQVLCFNCNCGKGQREECPHKTQINTIINSRLLGMDF